MIDADYRGEVKVLLFNHGGKDFEGGLCPMRHVFVENTTWLNMRMMYGKLTERTVKEGDRVAQLVLERVSLSIGYLFSFLKCNLGSIGGLG